MAETNPVTFTLAGEPLYQLIGAQTRYSSTFLLSRAYMDGSLIEHRLDYACGAFAGAIPAALYTHNYKVERSSSPLFSNCLL